MESFQLSNNIGLNVTFDRRQFNEENWLESYFIKIEGEDISAQIKVDNAPYGTSPLSLFDEMEKNWSGWLDNKVWSAIEGELNLIASYGSGGHIQLAIEINNLYSKWLVCAHINIEAGQLTNLFKQAESFFIC